MKHLALSINGTPIPSLSGIPSGGIDIGGNIIQLLTNILFMLAVVLTLIFIIYSGIQWTISGGDKQKIQQARARLTFSIIGLIIVAASFLIVNIIITIIGQKPLLFLNPLTK